jgi:hypothetical protein
MLIVTTVYVSQVESMDESAASATPEAVKMDDLPKIIESKLIEDPDPNRKLVVVYAGTNRAGGNQQ